MRAIYFMEAESKQPGRRSRIGSLVILLAVLLLGVTGGAYVLLYLGPAHLVDRLAQTTTDTGERGYDLGKRLAADLSGVFSVRPEVRVGEKVVLEANASVAELATARKEFTHALYWEHRWAGSTKRLELEGRFVAKAGYDLTQPFAIRISEDGDRVEAELPAAELLSLELVSEQIVRDEDGLWNKLSVTDREHAKNALLAGARQTALESSLLLDADRNLMARLETLVRNNSQRPVQITRTANP